MIQPPTEEEEKPWDIVEAVFEKPTGEKAYLLFSHFNGAGQPERAPVNIGTIESFLTKIKNRLSNRVRRSLFSSETYQVQVFVQHYGELEPSVKTEIQERYVEAREVLRQKFLNRSGKSQSAEEAPQ